MIITDEMLEKARKGMKKDLDKALSGLNNPVTVKAIREETYVGADFETALAALVAFMALVVATTIQETDEVTK